MDFANAGSNPGSRLEVDNTNILQNQSKALENTPHLERNLHLGAWVSEERLRTSSVNNHDRPLSQKHQLYKRIATDEASAGTEHAKNGDASVYASFHNLGTSGHLSASNPRLRRDIFYSGSIPDLDKRHKSSNRALHSEKLVHSSDNTHTAQPESPDHEKSRGKGYLQVALSMLSVHILKDPAFIVICVANSLVQGGFVLCVYFTVDYGISLGIDPQVASYLVSAYGKCKITLEDLNPSGL